jgi:hypothetical protein
MRWENILGARKKILKDFLFLLFGKFTFNLNVVGHGGKGKGKD